jgi:hypothetical protein
MPGCAVQRTAMYPDLNASGNLYSNGTAELAADGGPPSRYSTKMYPSLGASSGRRVSNEPVAYAAPRHDPASAERYPVPHYREQVAVSAATPVGRQNSSPHVRSASGRFYQVLHRRPLSVRPRALFASEKCLWCVKVLLEQIDSRRGASRAQPCDSCAVIEAQRFEVGATCVFLGVPLPLPLLGLLKSGQHVRTLVWRCDRGGICKGLALSM